MDQTIKKQNPSKPHLNIAFLGGFSSGKSTVVGQLIYLSEKLEQKKFDKI